ncbi:MAG: ATP-binding cassette domain-containing protein [Candidatus Aenigmarchaeota archaeon]|nr:ATP-binding cassette domain-containing protein [Candidatus Aenigmarchaeota archaeon]
MNEENIIKVRGISKEFKVQKEKNVFKALFSRKYKTVKALKKVNLDVKKGEFIGVVGPNGAGKSTLIKILTGILTPSSGKAEVKGLVPYEERQENSKKIGVVFGQRSQLWWDLPVIESFELLRRVFEIPDKAYNKNLRTFKDVLGIQKYLDTPTRKLSLGEKMRCNIAASLLHNPDIVYLDEPTIGLDVEAKYRIRKFLKKLNKEGLTIILTTHDMGDIEELCERMIIIDKGSVIYDGKTEEIKNKMTTDRMVVIDYRNTPPKIKLPKGVKLNAKEGDKIIYKVDTKKASVSGFIKSILMKHKVDDIHIEQPSVEEMIRKIYKKGI